MFDRITFITHFLPDFVADGTGPHQPENYIVLGVTSYHGVFIIIELISF